MSRYAVHADAAEPADREGQEGDADIRAFTAIVEEGSGADSGRAQSADPEEGKAPLKGPPLVAPEGDNDDPPPVRVLETGGGGRAKTVVVRPLSGDRNKRQQQPHRRSDPSELPAELAQAVEEQRKLAKAKRDRARQQRTASQNERQLLAKALETPTAAFKRGLSNLPSRVDEAARARRLQTTREHHQSMVEQDDQRRKTMIKLEQANRRSSHVTGSRRMQRRLTLQSTIPEDLSALQPAAPLSRFQLSARWRARLGHWAVPLLGVSSAALSAVTLAFLTGSQTPGEVIDALRAITPEDAAAMSGALSRVSAALLGMVMSVTAITVQLAASRFTHLCAHLFIIDPAVRVCLISYVVLASLSVLVFIINSAEQFVWRGGLLVSLCLLQLAIMMLLPYFVYVFELLDPNSIVSLICHNGLKPVATHESIAAGDHKRVLKLQHTCIESINDLGVIGLQAVSGKRKQIASTVFNALLDIASAYGASSKALAHPWFDVKAMSYESPDFLGAGESVLREGAWVEWTVLRQFELLYRETLASLSNATLLVAINTRHLVQLALARQDRPVVNMGVKYFNTYLATCINQGYHNAGSMTMQEYRKLVQYVIRMGGGDVDEDYREYLSTLVLDVARYMRYYVTLCAKRNQSGLLEIICHDVASLCETTFLAQVPYADALLDAFLTFDDAPELRDNMANLRGVRRAQIKLGVQYIIMDRREYAILVAEDMELEDENTMRALYQEILALNKDEAWEITDRFTNVNFMSIEVLAALPEFFLMMGQESVKWE